MDTWMLLNLTVDTTFALLLVGLVFGFVFMREKKIRNDITKSLIALTENGSASMIQQSEVAPTNRVEKYLEAVRLHRKGVNKNEIEKTLGISMMELELIGNIK